MLEIQVFVASRSALDMADSVDHSNIPEYDHLLSSKTRNRNRQ